MAKKREDKTEVIASKDPEVQVDLEESTEDLPSGEITSAAAYAPLVPGEGMQSQVTPNLATDPEVEVETVRVANDPAYLKKQAKETGQTAGKWDKNTSSEKTVIIVTTEKHRCKIGPKWWQFEKETKYRVPENVKEVLKRRGILGVI